MVKTFRGTKRLLGSSVSIFALLLVLSTGSGLADEAYRKYRVSFTINNQSTSDGLRTNADNTSLFRSPFGGLMSIDDPRPDSAAKNEATIKDDLRYNVQGSYGILTWKWGELTLDTSAGYFKGDVGNLEVSAQFLDVDPIRRFCGETTRYHVFYVPVGQVTEVPVQLGGTVRFRPRASGGPFRGMSPYLGLGAGYIFTKIDASEQFLAFSDSVAHSTGWAQRATGEGHSIASEPEHRFKAAEADAPDSFEYHARAGLEFPIRKGLSIVF